MVVPFDALPKEIAMHTWQLLVGSILLAAAVPNSDAPQKSLNAKTKPVALFDGKTFKGWEGNRDVFRIEDGAIVGGSLERPTAHNDFLCTEKKYGDFELRLKFKLVGKDTNAGVQFRSKRIPDNFEVYGYQADLGQGYWGCLYDESRRRRVLASPDAKELDKILKRGDWNEYVVRAQGKHIQLWINGHQTVDYTEKEPEIAERGIIGLQIHAGPPGEAWYKEITIKEL
jgi:hypothetical protein